MVNPEYIICVDTRDNGTYSLCYGPFGTLAEALRYARIEGIKDYVTKQLVAPILVDPNID